jgi:Flp pilus assembly pilin Flp
MPSRETLKLLHGGRDTSETLSNVEAAMERNRRQFLFSSDHRHREDLGYDRQDLEWFRDDLRRQQAYDAKHARQPDTPGSLAVQFGLIAVGIGVAVISVVQGLGDKLATKSQSFDTEINRGIRTPAALETPSRPEGIKFETPGYKLEPPT